MPSKYSFYGIYQFKEEAIAKAKTFDSRKRNIKIIPERRGYFSLLTKKRR